MLETMKFLISVDARNKEIERFLKDQQKDSKILSKILSEQRKWNANITKHLHEQKQWQNYQDYREKLSKALKGISYNNIGCPWKHENHCFLYLICFIYGFMVNNNIIMTFTNIIFLY